MHISLKFIYIYVLYFCIYKLLKYIIYIYTYMYIFIHILLLIFLLIFLYIFLIFNFCRILKFLKELQVKIIQKFQVFFSKLQFLLTGF